MTKQDEIQFTAFCLNATDNQLWNIWAKEKAANRADYARLARAELRVRGFIAAWGE